MPEMEIPAAGSRRALLRACVGGAAALAFATDAARPARAADGLVRIDNFAFSPTPLTIAPGTTVLWVNHDDIPHSVFFQQTGLRSHALDTNDAFSHRFDEAGTFDYVCGIHPHMRGRVVVRG
jgi:plastocyanin